MGDLTDTNTRDLTDTELFQLIQQWQNGSGSAFNDVAAWLWKKKRATVGRSAYMLGRVNDPDNLVEETFWEALEALDVKVSGGKILAKPTGRQKRMKEGLRPLFVGVYSRRELTVDGPLEWRGQNSFAALFRDIWLNRYRDAIRGKTPTLEVPTRTYDSLTGRMRDTTTRVDRLRRFDKRVGEEDENTSNKLFEDAIPDKTRDATVAAREIEGTFISALKQIIASSSPATAEIAGAVLRHIETEVRAGRVESGHLFDEVDKEELWESVRQNLALEDREKLYKPKQRFLDELRKYVPAPPKRRNNR